MSTKTNVGLSEKQREEALAETAKEQEGTQQARAPETGTALATYDFGDDAGAGMEGVDAAEFKIPFLLIVQSNSPAARPVSVGGSGAKAGSIQNRMTGDVLDAEAGVPFVPVYRGEHNYVEYLSREPDGSGGGFVGVRPIDDPLVLRLRAEKIAREGENKGRFGKLLTNEGTELAETRYVHGLVLADGENASMAAIGFSSTQLASYQAFVSTLLPIRYRTPAGEIKTPPLWAHKWLLKTRFRQRGVMSWYVWNLVLAASPPVRALMRPDDPLYQQARAFHALIKEGKVKADHAAFAEAETQAQAEPGAAEPVDGEMPF
jgi:hypothetical protein